MQDLGQQDAQAASTEQQSDAALPPQSEPGTAFVAHRAQLQSHAAAGSLPEQLARSCHPCLLQSFDTPWPEVSEASVLAAEPLTSPGQAGSATVSSTAGLAVAMQQLQVKASSGAPVLAPCCRSMEARSVPQHAQHAV